MKTYLLLLLPLFFAGIFACDRKAGLSTFQLDKSFTLDQGGTSYWEEDNSINVTFDRVVSDSRCPIDAECIWAGLAEVQITFTQSGLSQTDTLISGDFTNTNHTDTGHFGHFTVKLLQLQPAPLAGQPIPQEDYRVELIIAKE